MPDDLHQQFERKHLGNMNRASAEIRSAFDKSVREISLAASRIKLKGQVFRISQYPSLKRLIDKETRKLHDSIFITTTKYVKTSWALSNEKSDLLVEKRLGGRRPSPKGRQILFDPNKGALEEFLKRTEKGMNLSQRVWKDLEGFKPMLEQGLGIGISEGTPAKKLATDLKKYLNEPDKLFRRVRDAEGKLQLSPAAKAYKPGPGVYRSSYKNALRLTRTEVNMSYRTSDFERWQGIPFIVGVEVKLSASHVFRVVKGKKVCEICECLKGKYPKDFHFRGWHPSCLCYSVPIMMDDKEYSRLEDAILAGEPIPTHSKNEIHQPHSGFKDFMKTNGKKISKQKSKPYWFKDNKEFV